MEINFKTFKARSTSNIKKLTLDKDEQARVCFLEPAPRLVYIHSFEKVVTGDDGKPIETADTWPDGKPRISVKTEYAGKLRCLGDEDEIQRTGADPEHCPACRAHIENSNAVKAPTMRILGHVLKYSTKPGSFAAAKPFSASLLVWDLTAKRFEMLQGIYEEHGDLSEHDLCLGPCENKQMQKYTIAVAGGTASWRASAETRNYVTELLNENKVTDLESVAGKLPSEFEMEAKVKEVVRAYSHAYGTGSAAGTYESLLGSDNTSIAESADSEEEEDTATPATTPAPEEEDSLPEGLEGTDESEDDDESSDETDATVSLEALLGL